MPPIAAENSLSDLPPMAAENSLSDQPPMAAENGLSDQPPMTAGNASSDQPLKPEEHVLQDFMALTDQNALADLPPVEEEDVLPHLASILEENMLPDLPSLTEENTAAEQEEPLQNLQNIAAEHTPVEKEQKPKQSSENSSESDLDKLLMQMKIQQSAVSESALSPMKNKPELEPVSNEPELPPASDIPVSDEIIQTPEPEAPQLKQVQPEPEQDQDSKQHITSGTSGDSQEITPDRLAAMIANLGTDNIGMEPEPEAEKEQKPVMAETLEPSEPSSEQELDDILKAMDIDDILGESVEDLDIDKILESPASAGGKGGSDDGQVMSSEEIAALIANTDLLSEPEPAKKTGVSDLPDLSDPSHVMSSDEIAALLANM